MISVRGDEQGGTDWRVSSSHDAKTASSGGVLRFVRGFLGVVLMVGWVGCASPSTDYTPQIHVAPGAAARSLWILSKNAKKPAEDADAATATATDEETRDDTEEREAASAARSGVPAAEVAKVFDSVRVADAGGPE
jgi:hypothetical protein